MDQSECFAHPGNRSLRGVTDLGVVNRQVKVFYQSIKHCGCFSKPRSSTGTINPVIAAFHKAIAIGDENR